MNDTGKFFVTLFVCVFGLPLVVTIGWLLSEWNMAVFLLYAVVCVTIVYRTVFDPA